MEPQKRLFLSHLIFSILASAVLIGLVVTAYQFRLLERFDLLVYDRHVQWRGPLPSAGRIALVLMDQKSASELGRKRGSWSRAQLAQALANLTAAGASVIGLDMIFFAPGERPEDDEALARAIGEGGNVVLSRFVAQEGRAEVAALQQFQEGMLGDGFINMFPDRDGVLRKIPFFSVRPEEEGLAVSPAFFLEVVRAFLNLDFELDFSGPDHFRIGREGEGLVLPYPDLRIHYIGGSDSFPSISFADAVFNRFEPSALQGKIVLIGSGLATDKDFFATPFSGYRDRAGSYKKKFGRVLEEDLGEKTAGVACHALAVETVLTGKFVRKFPERYVAGLTVLLGILGLAFYLPRPGALGGVLIALAASGAILGISHAAFSRNLVWVETAPFLAVLWLQYVSGIAVQRAYSRKKNRVVTSLFGKYVSEGVVADILKGKIGVSFEGRSREVTVLFSDLRGFTTISEGLSPQETGKLLNGYFDAMIPIVFAHQGTLDKLMGDAVMAFFNAPGEVREHAAMAAETALEMTRRLGDLKKNRPEKGIERLAVGIGLNTGVVTVGNLGSRYFMDYTVIGDAVNLGSRLEGLNKVYGTSIIAGQATVQQLGDRFAVRELDRVKVKGKGEAVAIYELIDQKDGLDEAGRRLIEVFETGLRKYRDRDFEGAEKEFQKGLDLLPGDGPSTLYLKRTREFLQNPPGPEWDGVTAFTTK
jgi:adenylate cyclase